MPEIKAILEKRGKRYGEFETHAEITQHLKNTMHHTSGWDKLDAPKKECLEMIAHKIGRILNGDPSYLDSWVDIIGYTQLVVDLIK